MTNEICTCEHLRSQHTVSKGNKKIQYYQCRKREKGIYCKCKKFIFKGCGKEKCKNVIEIIKATTELKRDSEWKKAVEDLDYGSKEFFELQKELLAKMEVKG